MSALLAIENLSFSHGSTRVLSGASLILQPGITGIIGAQGTGKTTLLRLMLGLLAPAAGNVHLFDGDPAMNSALRRKAGYLPQQFSPKGSLPLADYLEALTLLTGRIPSEARALAQTALERLDLGEAQLRPLSSLSEAETRRLGVAQAIVHEPRLLLADEPVAGLTAGERQALLDKLRELAEARPVILASHVADEVERTADHVWFLQSGRLIAADSQRG